MVAASREPESQLCELDSRLAGARSATALLRASFAVQRGAPGFARRMVVRTLRRHGHRGALVDDVALVVSELATNAVRHAATPFSLVLEVRGATVRVAVHDHTPLRTDTPHWYLIPQPLHGLGIVAAIASRWGVEARHDGKVVWADLAVPASRGGAQATGCSAPRASRSAAAADADVCASRAGTATAGDGSAAPSRGHGGPGRAR
jgi:Histidine kinase-like ATPase domain